MATLTSDQGTLIISVPAGSSLRVYSKSGTPTVSGSSVSVEDVTTTLGCYVYGPQTSNSTISLTTTGIIDYDVVAGDPTPYGAQMMFNRLNNTLPAQEASAVRSASSAQATAFTSRALVAADNGGVFQTTTSQTVTINTGVTGFNGCVFYGPVTFTGTATLDDKRTTGADTDIAMVQRLTGTDSFRIIGGSV